MYGCESWTIKKSECWRMDAFELWCWRSLLRVPRTARRSNQSFPTEISPDYSLEGLMLKLKLQYFGPLMGGTDSFEKTLMWGKIEGRRKRGQQMRWLDGISDSMDLSWWWTWRPGVLQSMGSQRIGHDWATELNWTVAATAANSGQSRPTLCKPIDGSPTGSSVPGILQARILEWVAISFFNHESEKWKWSHSVVSDS